ncbi:MAG: DUF2236 domain-containing protein, partial [Psychrobacter sp.]|nr:DUF2236 domain-containing protein [Psychrobacter sp.]
MDSINISNKQTANTLNRKQPSVASYQRHGRTTAIDDHSDLQVLKRIKRYLLPKNFVISQDLLDEIVAGYDIGDPLTDALAAKSIRFAKPLQQFIIDDSNYQLDPNLANNPSFSALTEQFSH